MKNKKLILAAIALVAVVGILLGVYFATRPKPVEGSKTITVTVIHKDGTTKNFTYQTDAEYLAQVLLDEKLVEGDQTEFGLTISKVDGEVADWSVDQGWWQIFVGDVAATAGASGIAIQNGDSFKLVYTIGYGG